MENDQNSFYDELVDRCKQGDEWAFTELYQRNAKAVYNSIYRIVGHRGEAEDLLQECFVAVFEQIKKYEYRSHFGAWIKRIALNKAISYLRRKKVRFYEMKDSHEPIQDENVDEVEFELKVEDVKRAIDRLPLGYKAVITLHLIEDIPQHEIAEMLGISHSAVRSQYHRAKANILKNIKSK